MKTLLVIGNTGTGKTFYIKKLLKKIPNKETIIIYDVNNEYKDFYPFEFLDIEEFLENIVDVQKCVIVIEEATIFFNNRSSDEILTNIIVRKRHNNNFTILVFHSLRTVPRYIYDVTNYVMLFKTNDSSQVVWEKFRDPVLLKHFTDLQQENSLHAKRFYKVH